jgi:hypothetical protein
MTPRGVRTASRLIAAAGQPGWRHLDGVVAAAERGIQRIRGTPHPPFSFLRCCGLSQW